LLVFLTAKKEGYSIDHLNHLSKKIGFGKIFKIIIETLNGAHGKVVRSRSYLEDISSDDSKSILIILIYSNFNISTNVLLKLNVYIYSKNVLLIILFK
jgi:hypothetical protein